MALSSFCTKCQELTMHNSRGQCLNCKQNNRMQEFEDWRSDKSIKEQIEGLYFMIREKEDKTVLY